MINSSSLERLCILLISLITQACSLPEGVPTSGSTQKIGALELGFGDAEEGFEDGFWVGFRNESNGLLCLNASDVSGDTLGYGARLSRGGVPVKAQQFKDEPRGDVDFDQAAVELGILAPGQTISRYVSLEDIYYDLPAGEYEVALTVAAIDCAVLLELEPLEHVPSADLLREFSITETGEIGWPDWYLSERQRMGFHFLSSRKSKVRLAVPRQVD